MIRPSARTVTGLALSLGLSIGMFGACNSPAASNIPSNILPTTIPSLDLGSLTIPSIAIPSLGSGSTACVDPSVFAILNQTMQSGADVPTVLSTNKAALLTGLQSFQPSDPAAMTWKTNLINALNSNAMNDAADQIEMLTNGQVNISSC